MVMTMLPSQATPQPLANVSEKAVLVALVASNLIGGTDGIFPPRPLQNIKAKVWQLGVRLLFRSGNYMQNAWSCSRFGYGFVLTHRFGGRPNATKLPDISSKRRLSLVSRGTSSRYTAETTGACGPLYNVGVKPLRAEGNRFGSLAAVAAKPTEQVSLEPALAQIMLEYLAVGKPKVHVMQGLAKQRPSAQVMEAINNRIEEQSPMGLGMPMSQLAFFVMDLNRAREKFALWRECLPHVVPHYAVKANPDPELLKLMVNEFGKGSTEFGFDCASRAEIKLVLSLGARPDQIIFANPCKAISHVEYSDSVGVLRTTFDSEAELCKLKAVQSNAEVVLRLWTDDRHSQCPLSNKYGAHRDEVLPLLQLAKNLGLKCVGISFHCGSGASVDAYRDALKDAKVAFDLGRKVGHPMELLDIGGGFPGVESETCSFREIAREIAPILKRDWQGVRKIAEPGRFFCASTQTLATQIIGKRVRESKGGKREYYVNDGLYQSFNCILYDHSVILPEPTGDSDSPRLPSKLFGQTCDGLDTFAEDIRLPELAVGDWLAVPVMGAYTNGAASNFNGFDTNPTIYVNQ
eukprot:g29974.t1